MRNIYIHILKYQPLSIQVSNLIIHVVVMMQTLLNKLKLTIQFDHKVAVIGRKSHRLLVKTYVSVHTNFDSKPVIDNGRTIWNISISLTRVIRKSSWWNQKKNKKCMKCSKYNNNTNGSLWLKKKIPISNESKARKIERKLSRDEASCVLMKRKSKWKLSPCHQ